MTAVYDPFPMPAHQGLQPTSALDWDAIASALVERILRLEPRERVLFSADPYFGGAALDAVRRAVQRARGIELATILHWTPTLAALRRADGRHPDPETDRAECEAIRQLFGLADVFVLMMNDRRRPRRTVAGLQVEPIVEQWPGRAVHLHWFHDPVDPDPASPVNRALDAMYQRAIVEADPVALGRTMHALRERIAGRELRLQDPRGTDLRMRAPHEFHLNYGDASRARIAAMTCGRDREEEVPAGSFRLVPQPDSAEGVVVFPVVPAGESPNLGRGFDCEPFARAGLRLHYAQGRVRRVQTGGDDARLQALWAAETGDKDRVGELVIGCNPLLARVPGSGFEPHYGFGAGVLRLILGDNLLSGGRFVSSFHRWLMLSDASLSVEGEAIVDGGRFVWAT